MDFEYPAEHRIPAGVKVILERVQQFTRGLEELGCTVAFEGDRFPGYRTVLLETIRASCGDLLAQVQGAADKILDSDRKFKARQANQEQKDDPQSQEEGEP